MIGNWARTTTTTASGTTDIAGLTAVSGFPTIGDIILLNAYCWYVILDSADKPLEAGVGRRTSATNISRLKVSKTYTGGVYDDTDPTALTLVNATTYNVIISPIDASVCGAMPGISTTHYTKAVLTSLPTSLNSTMAMVDDRQYLMPFFLSVGGVLRGFVFDVTTAGANSVCQAGIYSLNHNGDPVTLLGRTADALTDSTGSKQPAIVTPIWTPPGWYAVSLSSKNAVDAVAPTVRARTVASDLATPWGINNSGGSINNSISLLYKTNAAWTDLADVDVSSGWTAAAAIYFPALALLFE